MSEGRGRGKGEKISSSLRAERGAGCRPWFQGPEIMTWVETKSQTLNQVPQSIWLISVTDCCVCKIFVCLVCCNGCWILQQWHLLSYLFIPLFSVTLPLLPLTFFSSCWSTSSKVLKEGLCMVNSNFFDITFKWEFSWIWNFRSQVLLLKILLFGLLATDVPVEK